MTNNFAMYQEYKHINFDKWFIEDSILYSNTGRKMLVNNS